MVHNSLQYRHWETGKNWGTKPYKASPSEGYPHKILYPPPQKVNENIQRYPVTVHHQGKRLWSNTVLTSGSKYQGVTNSILFLEIRISQKVCSPRERPVGGELSQPIPICNLSVQAQSRWVGNLQNWNPPHHISLSLSFPFLFLICWHLMDVENKPETYIHRM